MARVAQNNQIFFYFRSVLSSTHMKNKIKTWRWTLHFLPSFYHKCYEPSEASNGAISFPIWQISKQLSIWLNKQFFCTFRGRNFAGCCLVFLIYELLRTSFIVFVFGDQYKSVCCTGKAETFIALFNHSLRNFITLELRKCSDTTGATSWRRSAPATCIKNPAAKINSPRMAKGEPTPAILFEVPKRLEHASAAF